MSIQTGKSACVLHALSGSVRLTWDCSNTSVNLFIVIIINAFFVCPNSHFDKSQSLMYVPCHCLPVSLLLEQGEYNFFFRR